MWNKIYSWFIRYNSEINWFLTGWFAAYFCVDVSAGNWLGAAIDAVIVAANIAFYRK